MVDCRDLNEIDCLVLQLCILCTSHDLFIVSGSDFGPVSCGIASLSSQPFLDHKSPLLRILITDMSIRGACPYQ